jgi:hypothetical protein
MMTTTYDPRKLTGALLAAYKRHGGLTLREIAQIEQKPLDVSHIWQAFEAARGNGVARPRIHVDGYTFKMAPETGANAGAIYVTEDTSGFNEYLGKIMEGRFIAARACVPEQRDAILAAAANPLEAVLAFGRKYGKCSICARPLTDPESVRMGIGPICRQRFGL